MATGSRQVSDERYTIRQMCEMFGVTARTLRFYESKELLAPERAGQKRLYTRRDRGRMKLIMRGKRFGFSLEEIRQMLDLYDTEGRNEAQIMLACRKGRERLGELERQRADLDDAIRDLRSHLEHCAGLFDTGNGQQAAE